MCTVCGGSHAEEACEWIDSEHTNYFWRYLNAVCPSLFVLETADIPRFLSISSLPTSSRSSKSCVGNNLYWNFIYLCICAAAQRGPLIPRSSGFYITQRHTTLGRTPLDEWSARLRDLYVTTYVVGSKSFRPDQHFKLTEIKQLCYFSAWSPFISTQFSTGTLTSP